MQEGVEGGAMKCFSKFISLCLWKDGKSSKLYSQKEGYNGTEWKRQHIYQVNVKENTQTYNQHIIF